LRHTPSGQLVVKDCSQKISVTTLVISALGMVSAVTALVIIALARHVQTEARNIFLDGIYGQEDPLGRRTRRFDKDRGLDGDRYERVIAPIINAPLDTSPDEEADEPTHGPRAEGAGQDCRDHLTGELRHGECFYLRAVHL